MCNEVYDFGFRVLKIERVATPRLPKHTYEAISSKLGCRTGGVGERRSLNANVSVLERVMEPLLNGGKKD